MKRIKILLSVLFIIYNYLFAYEKIVLWDNEEVKADDFVFDGQKFIFDSDKVDIDKVSFIKFNIKESFEDFDDNKLEDISAEELLKRAEHLGKKYPDNSLLVLYDDGVQKLNKDGTQYSRSRYSIKIMNESELTNSILSFYHEKGSHEVKIVMARSISEEGNISYLKRSDITYTSPKQDLQFFSGKKDIYLIRAVIPDVKVGSIIDYEYEIIEASPEDENQFYTNWFFGGDNPVYESSVKFIVPENKSFYWVSRNFAPFNDKPIISIKDGYRIYSFRRGEHPPFIAEPDCPPKAELFPFVIGSSFKDQTYLSGWISRFLKERINSNDKMKDTVGSLLKEKNAKTEEEKVAVIYRFVQDYIHYRSIKTSISSGYTGHPATETFDNRYGDCIDKAILFSSLLKTAGVEAYPVIVMTNNKPRVLFDEIGLINGNHAITEIHLKEKEKKIIYLDSTSTTYRYPSFRYDDQGIPAWNPILNTVREINPTDPEINTSVFEKNIVLNKDGSGEVASYNVYSGDQEAGIRSYFIALKEKEIESLLRSIISRDYPGSLLNSYEYKDPNDYTKNLFLKMSYLAGNMAKKTGDFLIMELPISYNFDNVTLKNRNYPLVYSTTSGKKNKIKIKIPEGYRIKDVPEPIKIDNKYFSYQAGYKISDDQIYFEDHYIRSGIRIKAEDYSEFRKDILKMDYFTKTPIIINKE
ncbi:MAG: DUF3857 domain-containing protein [Spirochaetes bacterium]|nr:DUF3857 domain-containing protein [Spirochaetota bacterium]